MSGRCGAGLLPKRGKRILGRNGKAKKNPVFRGAVAFSVRQFLFIGFFPLSLAPDKLC